MTEIIRNKHARKHFRKAKHLPIGKGGGVELLLIQTIDPLGKQGDIVEVKPGYANNYLIPQGLAAIASDHHKRMVEKHKAKLAAIQKKRLASLQSLAEEIRSKHVSISANASEDGHLYGSVGPEEIVKALRNEGIVLTADQVRLAGSIKETALYTVKIYLGHGIESELKVWVVPTTSEK
ncbi:MAG: 50S ribosomal protein L9 [Planctomycetaceae bacterium]|nr:50S ribosomal protein L9 [Planctomycetaceae bacterium]